MKTTEQKQTIALYRYSIILPLINDEYDTSSKECFFRKKACEIKVDAFGVKREYSKNTIKNWYLNYIKKGFDGLMPNDRSDLGENRSFTEEITSKIIEIKQTFRRAPCTVIYDKLCEEELIDSSKVSLRTLQRYMKTLDFTKEINTKQRLKYEMKHTNECWQADTTYFPFLKIGKEKKRLYVMVIIDDFSRMVVGAKAYFEDNTINFFDVTMDAIKQYGIPKKMFVDNGKNYKNMQVDLLFARLGSRLIHAAPYSGASKGKVERFNKTIKDKMMSITDFDSFNSLEEVNKSISDFVKKYNNTKHSGIGNIPPFQRYQMDLENIKREKNDVIEQFFLMEKICRVYRDSTIKFNKMLYGVPIKYCNEYNLKIRYSPCINHVYICLEDDTLIEIYPIDVNVNANVARLSLKEEM